MSDSDTVLMHIVITRYFSILERRGSFQTISNKKAVDLLAHIHCNCCPLDLEKLSICDEYSFMRCMIGIIENYSVDNNSFNHGYWPNYALHRPT